jgi:hypothetical protein
MRGAVVVAFIVALSGAVGAQERSSPLPSHLPLQKEACFGRTYDADYLQRNPKQRVTRFHLFRDFAIDKTAESPPLSASEFLERDGEGGTIGLTAYVGFRDKPGVFTNWLSCGKSSDGAGVRCGVECDGGGFKIGAKDITLKDMALLVENQGFVVTGGCGANEGDQERRDFVEPGEADRQFVLDPLPVGQCTAIRDSLKPTWASLGAPIRERLTKNGAVCFSRNYDAAHLAKHPKQTVKRIAVLKPQGGKMLHGAHIYELTFRVELKDGRKVTKKTTCQPSKYAYGCTHDPALDTQEDFYLTRAGDNEILLRDKRARLEKLFGAALGADDRTFRLSASPAGACRF